MFFYSSYWKTWSRVLSGGRAGSSVELNLTPTNWRVADQGQWDSKVRPIRIRRHSTGMDRGDKLVDTLTAEVRAVMVKHLGADLTARLLTEDFMSQINWEKYHRVCNGGANLSDIRKD